MIQPYYMNRELSWIKFNERVLEEAEDPNVPLLEQLSFSAIYQSNLDEFVQVRIGTMLDRMESEPKKKDSRSGMKPKQQLKAMLAEIENLLPRKDRAYYTTMDKLKEFGIVHVSFSDASPEEKIFLEQYFKREVKMLLSPIVLDKRQPFPFLKNKAIYIAVHLASKSGVRMGIVPAGVSDRMIRLGKSGRFILLEDLILHFAPQLFKNDKVLDAAVIRVTRSGSISFESSAPDENTDFRDTMKELIRKRNKQDAVRLQMNSMLDEEATDYLLKKLKLSRKQLFLEQTPLDLSFVYQLGDFASQPELKFPMQKPQPRADISPKKDMMSQIARHDILLSYPYESISPFLRLLDEAALDPDVASIKIPLYRLASNSRVIDSLCQAAENGKEVLVLVELRARFDEENNIQWAERLLDAGCTVIYGPHNMKVHSKLLLITRKTENGAEYFVQVGTGNYNETTSEQYTDLSVITADQTVGQDAAQIFESLSLGQAPSYTEALWAAPNHYRTRVLRMIEDETASGEAGRIAIKQAYNEQEEAQAVLNAVLTTNDITSCAVLSNNLKYFDPLITLLQNRSIPYKVLGGRKTLKKHIRFMNHILRIIESENAYSIRKIAEYANIPITENGKKKKSLFFASPLGEIVRSIQEKVESLPFSSIAALVVGQIMMDPEDDPSITQDYMDFQSWAGDYASISDYLAAFATDRERFAQFYDSDYEECPIPTDRGYLTLSTIHSAKGLEWDHVFIMGLEEGNFPNPYFCKGKTDQEIADFLVDLIGNK